jgi:tetratricopeptide (TPR) repeat protein
MDCQRVVTLSPRDARAFAQYGGTLDYCGRYREAVALLMQMGRVEEADLACRSRHDDGLSARYAEDRGDMGDAARSYMAARDYESALRCYRATNNGRGVVRAYERMGRVKEAIDAAASLGLDKEVERLRKKYPMAGHGDGKSSTVKRET